jgi:hypothetical protein
MSSDRFCGEYLGYKKLFPEIFEKDLKITGKETFLFLNML